MSGMLFVCVCGDMCAGDNKPLRSSCDDDDDVKCCVGDGVGTGVPMLLCGD